MVKLESKMSGPDQALRVRKLFGERQSCLHSCESSIRKAEDPQRSRHGTFSQHFAVMTDGQIVRMVPVRRVNLRSAIRMFESFAESAELYQRGSRGTVRFHNQRWVVKPPCKFQQLICNFQSRFYFSADNVKQAQQIKNVEQRRRRPVRPEQLLPFVVNFLDFSRCKALKGHQ